jgi:hypothetical protein
VTPTARFLCAETGDHLITVAVPHERDGSRLLDLVLESARLRDGVFAKMASISVEVGDDVLCGAMPITRETAERIWGEVRRYWMTADEIIAESKRKAEVAA